MSQQDDSATAEERDLPMSPGSPVGGAAPANTLGTGRGGEGLWGEEVRPSG